MLTQVARFELRYQLRSPLFVVSAVLFFLFPFAATTNDQIQIGAKGNGNVNSPYAILSTLGMMSVLGVLVRIERRVMHGHQGLSFPSP